MAFRVASMTRCDIATRITLKYKLIREGQQIIFISPKLNVYYIGDVCVNHGKKYENIFKVYRVQCDKLTIINFF